MLVNLAILAALVVPSIMAALTRENMADALIGTKEGDLERTFKKLVEEQDKRELSYALVDVAKVPEHMPKVVTCLRTVVDPFLKEMSSVNGYVYFDTIYNNTKGDAESNVNVFVQGTLYYISVNTRGDAESFAKMIASFEPSDAKPLASIRYLILRRSDAVKVLERVMDKSPTLITVDLPRWLANHSFNQNSRHYTLHKVTREQAFQYLTFFATERVLKDALSIVTKNEHYKVDYIVWCCDSHNSFPQDLYNKLSALLERLQRRNTLSGPRYSHFYHRCLSS